MNNVQIIKTNNVPTYAVWVLPYQDYKKLSHQIAQEAEAETIPHEVVSYMVDHDCSIVKAWRVCLNKTQKAIAGKMGITQGSYSTIENSKTNQKATLEKLATALGISPVQLDVYE
ncbi:MAG: helix-turn-helix transcriptional regulator [Lentisphaerota bacterium]